MMRATSSISKTQWLVIVALLLSGAGGAAAILASHDKKPAGSAHQHAHGHEDAHADESKPAKGPHGGQSLNEGDFGLEILLAESQGTAWLRAWVYEKSQPMAPAEAQHIKVTVVLSRPTGERHTFVLAATPNGSLTSSEPVAEPHVFDAQIEVQTPREPYLFAWSQQEGKVLLSDAQWLAAGVKVQSAIAAPIQASLQVPGEIRFNQDRTAHVVPNVAGVVEAVSARLGQQVRKGEVLAVLRSAGISEQRAALQAARQRRQLAQTTYEREKRLWEEKISPQQDVLQAEQALREAEILEANARQKLQALGAAPESVSLSRYELRAPFNGTVVEKHLTLGEAVKEDAAVFTVSDLSSVWVETSVAAKDVAEIHTGTKVTVRSSATRDTAPGTVAYVGPLLGEQTRTALARITLPNSQGRWRPGLFVTVELVTSEAHAPVTVTSEAIQQIDDRTVVYLKVPGGFVPQPVELGRSDGKRVEVLRGLQPGAPHAGAGSFLVKAEAGKSSAEHVH